MKNLRSLIGAMLITGSLLPAQELKNLAPQLTASRAFAVDQMEPPPVLPFQPMAYSSRYSAQDVSSIPAPKPAAAVARPSSGRKKWIILGAVAGSVIVAGTLAYKRFSNEGLVVFK